MSGRTPGPRDRVALLRKEPSRKASSARESAGMWSHTAAAPQVLMTASKSKGLRAQSAKSWWEKTHIPASPFCLSLIII